MQIQAIFVQQMVARGGNEALRRPCFPPCSGWCLKEFGVVYNTAYRDLDGLVRLGVLNQEGSGRGTRYTIQVAKP